MFFRYEPKPDLPRLAWGASLRAGDPAVRVQHGPWVETRDEGFVEGAWDGPFGALGLAEATMLVGSGATLGPEGLVFAGHSDLHERLYAIRVADTLHIAPSLALALALSGTSLDPQERHYYLAFVDAYRAGIRRPRKRIRLARGVVADLHDVCNLRVTTDLRVERVEKRWPAAPSGFDSYVATMRGTLAKVLANAADPARAQRFRPVCTISRGYDSVAIAALATQAGCREGVTFHESGAREGSAVDDGSDIGRVLGYETTVYSRIEPPGPREGLEEFYMEPWGIDCDATAMASQLPGAVLLTGRSTSGWEAGSGARWGLPGNSGMPDLQRPIPYTPGCALTDFRMRVGFLHFAVPAIAAIHGPVLHRLTESDEMRPWRLGGRYDKPIPRRIAEDAGVPRHLFGMAKMGGPKRPARRPSAVARLRAVAHRVLDWAPVRLLLLAVLGNRLHPRWAVGSFEVQAAAGVVVERYRRALSA